MIQIAICFNDTESPFFWKKSWKITFENCIISCDHSNKNKWKRNLFHWNLISLSIVLRECLIKGFESVMRTHLIFVSTITTAGGVKQHNTTVYFINLFKISTQDKELWISFCVRVSPKILSLNTFSSTTWMYTSDRG